MFRSLLRFVGRWALLLAVMLFLALVTIFAAGSFILTWPLHRQSPKEKRIKASMELAQAGMQWLSVFSENSLRKQVEDMLNTDEPDITYPYPDGDTLVLGPEVFVSNDGSVLCWRGENFIPQSLSSVVAKLETEWDDPDTPEET